MLSIRMKRLGRKGHPTYRVVVQDSHQSPTSGKYVALLGSYDPHTKQSTLVKDKAEFYLKNGAQPSDRVVALFKDEKISLPKWVKQPAKKSKELKNPDKLRRNRPADAAPASPASEEPDQAPEDAVAGDANPEPTESVEEKVAVSETSADTETKSEESKDSADEAQEAAASEEEAKPEDPAEESSDEDEAPDDNKS